MHGDTRIWGRYPIETINCLVRTVRIYNVFTFAPRPVESVRASVKINSSLVEFQGDKVAEIIR